MMQFYGYWRSSAAYRCRIAFALKGLHPETTFVHLRRGGGEQKSNDFLTLNPQALVPVLNVDGDILTQSLAIIEWLDETYPQPPLLPASSALKARVRAFAQIIACEIHPLQNLRVLEYLKDTIGIGQDAANAWCQKWIGDGLKACEAHLVQQVTGSAFCFGETPSLADICLAPQLYSAQRFGVSLDGLDRLQALAERYAAHPAFLAAHPDVQLDKDA